MRKDRISKYRQIESLRHSKLIVFCTSDRPGLEIIIAPDIISPLTNHLDVIGDVEKITLFIYTRGGITLAAWSFVNLLRSFCKDLEVIVPFNCHSAGTLICLGANKIIMTKQATLGPIDPSTNGLLNPIAVINNQQIKVPVSVEHVNGYLDMAKNDFSIKKGGDLKEIYLKLSEKIHPLSLGEVYRSKAQIQMLARKLLKNQGIGEKNIKEIIKFLCSDSGSHDYTINRKEVRDDLGLNMEKPDQALYSIIKAIYDDIENELELKTPYQPATLLGNNSTINYSFHRGILESIDGGADIFTSEGTLTKLPQSQINQQIAIQDNRTFEGWKHYT
ncbi:MAG: serine protease [Patescibacteria group bacterium]